MTAHRADLPAVTAAHPLGFAPRHCSGVTTTGSDCIAHDHPSQTPGGTVAGWHVRRTA